MSGSSQAHSLAEKVIGKKRPVELSDSSTPPHSPEGSPSVNNSDGINPLCLSPPLESFGDRLAKRKSLYNPNPQLRSAPQDATQGTAGDRLVLVMVGLPARGKTYIANRVARYLRFFHGAPAKVFNVGNYRRQISGAKCSAAFFDPNNKEATGAREQAAKRAMQDLKGWLTESNDKGRVAIFDATNTTNRRRKWIIDELLGIMESRSHIIFLESVCSDENIINENIRAVKLNMPDYEGVDKEQAAQDFRNRIDKYKSIYEPITDTSMSYIRLVDAGRQCVMNNIKGFLAGRIMNFLMNLHFHPRPIYLSRHGQSQYNKLGKIGGDSALSEAGEEYAVGLAKYAKEHILVDNIEGIKGNCQHARLFTSSLRRTQLTARHISHDKLDDGWIVMRPKVLRNLDEIYAGIFDGYTYKEIKEIAPDEFKARSANKLTYRYPRGESYLDVIDRLVPVIQEVERTQDPILIVGHQGILRIIYAYFMDMPREKAPFVKIPLNTVIKLIPEAYGCQEERICLIPMEDKEKNVQSH